MVPMKQCRVCGKEYEPCHSTGLQNGVFRWREVSCSPECGEIYLKRIIESRTSSQKKVKKQTLKPVDTDIVVNSAETEDAIDSNRD